jgi:hypothetical protein
VVRVVVLQKGTQQKRCTTKSYTTKYSNNKKRKGMKATKGGTQQCLKQQCLETKA